MRSHLVPASGFFLTLLVLAHLPATQAMGGYTVDPAVEGVVRGDQHWAFPAGYIRLSMPSEGVVNQVTGDSQVAGSRMLVGGAIALGLALAGAYSGEKLMGNVAPDEPDARSTARGRLRAALWSTDDGTFASRRRDASPRAE